MVNTSSSEPVIDAATIGDSKGYKQSESSTPNHLAVVGRGMLKNNALLAPALDANISRWHPWSGFIRPQDTTQAFIGWGNKKSFRRARRLAKRQHLAVWSLEDGFIRSLDTGIGSRFGMSIVTDDLGIYFDLRGPSRLEQLIIDSGLNWSGIQSQAARRLINKLGELELSKYNANLDCPNLTQLAAVKSFSGSHILLIDQVQGDASIAGAGATAKQFKDMLKVACEAHPQSSIWIKAHPAGKMGYLTGLNLPSHVQVISEAVNPIGLLKQANHVYTVSSHMGFEALMLGKVVHCFGVSWYSGWGLTDDSHAPKRLLKKVRQRRIKVLKENAGCDLNNVTQTLKSKHYNRLLNHLSIEQLFHAAYLRYSRYANPASGQSTDLEAVINWLVSNRQWQSALSGPLTIYEFSRWKLPFVKAFVDFPQTQLFFKPKPRLKNLLHPNHLRMDLTHPVLVWGLGKRQALEAKLAKKSASLPPIYCMEDGFIRSNGLGATLLAPLSVVIDKEGIYYDASRPSDLEQLLVSCPPLNDEQRQRVEALWQRLLIQRVSKYNVGQAGIFESKGLESIANKTNKLRRLLVVGQVEDDLSVCYCGSLIKTNAALIERVRADNPTAYIIYKPHPDVEAGLRSGKVNPTTLTLVDHVAYEVAMPDCLDNVDEVHTISSLTGFEALLRGLDV
ncbi:MAG: hypothetical protein Q4P13_13100, partial [Psychrobacter sp.]|nr:hypothetical protein [Psychrobacter sp.]